MIRRLLVCIFVLASMSFAQATNDPAKAPNDSAKKYTLTVVVENVNQEGGNVGVLVFNSTKGWPEDRLVALKDVTTPAHPGTVPVKITDLPAGTYAVAVAHDVNVNHKLDKNFLGVPKEQWAMSNNPHALIKAPSFNTAHFELKDDMEIHVRLQ